MTMLSKMKSCLAPFKAKKLRRYIQNEQWTSACERCESHPEEATVWTAQQGFYEGKMNTQVLPIHLACCARAPLEVFKSLIKAYPEGVKSREARFRRLPLHLACIFGTSADVIKMLLFYGLGADDTDMAGRTPLFYALAGSLSTDVISCILERAPDVAEVADYKGWLPIHVACHCGASDESITLLLNAYPESVSRPTKHGSLAKIPHHLLPQECQSPRSVVVDTSSFFPMTDTDQFPQCMVEEQDEISSYQQHETRRRIYC